MYVRLLQAAWRIAASAVLKNPRAYSTLSCGLVLLLERSVAQRGNVGQGEQLATRGGDRGAGIPQHRMDGHPQEGYDHTVLVDHMLLQFHRVVCIVQCLKQVGCSTSGVCGVCTCPTHDCRTSRQRDSDTHYPHVDLSLPIRVSKYLHACTILACSIGCSRSSVVGVVLG